jgi:hypothetical protein
MKSSFHCLIPFLPLFCNCQSRRLDSTQFLCSQFHILADWHLETRLDSTRLDSTRLLLLPASEFFLRTTLQGPRRKQSQYIIGKACLQRHCIATEFTRLLLAYSFLRGYFTESLPRNERLFWLHYSGFRTSCHNMLQHYSHHCEAKCVSKYSKDKEFKISNVM